MLEVRGGRSHVNNWATHQPVTTKIKQSIPIAFRQNCLFLPGMLETPKQTISDRNSGNPGLMWHNLIWKWKKIKRLLSHDVFAHRGNREKEEIVKLSWWVGLWTVVVGTLEMGAQRPLAATGTKLQHLTGEIRQWLPTMTKMYVPNPKVKNTELWLLKWEIPTTGWGSACYDIILMTKKLTLIRYHRRLCWG